MKGTLDWRTYKRCYDLGKSLYNGDIKIKDLAKRLDVKGLLNLPSSISYSNTQIQKKFKHASDFGISGNYNKTNATEFKNALDKHIKSANNVYKSKISGTGDVYVYIKDKNLAVFVDTKGNFVSGRRLNQQQLDYHTLHHGIKIK